MDTTVIAGEQLRRLSQGVATWERRDLLPELSGYLDSAGPEVCVLSGLRRTGKKTMMLQAIADAGDDMLPATAYIDIAAGDTLLGLYRDLHELREGGVRRVFIDEVTALEDFTDGAAQLADVFAAGGMRVVISGTDSLSFWFAEGSSLYDRCRTIHTTHIPFSEHSRLLGTDSVDGYIRQGGVLGASHTGRGAFSDPDASWRYVDSAIARNIQNGLDFYRDGREFGPLMPLYDAGELTNTINRIVQNENHMFVRRTIDKAFVSRDLRMAKRNLSGDVGAMALGSDMDEQSITRDLKKALAILDEDERSLDVTDAQLYEVRRYLLALGLVLPYTVRHLAAGRRDEVLHALTQPGLRLSQAQELVGLIEARPEVRRHPLTARQALVSRINGDVLGGLLEETVLVETLMSIGREGPARVGRGKEAYKLRDDALALPDGGQVSYEFDMVVQDWESLGVDLYEVKHSRAVDAGQCRHLDNRRLLEYIERRVGDIGRRAVIYNGESLRDPLNNGVEYLNAAEYLKGLDAREHPIIPSRYAHMRGARVR